MSISRLIFIHCGPFAYQAFYLQGTSTLSGGSITAKQAVVHSLGLLFDPGMHEAIGRQWFQRAEARLLFEIQGQAGPFLLLMLPGGDLPAYYLLNSDYERSLLLDAKQRVRSESQLLAEMKRRGLSHSERLPDAAALWQQLDLAPAEGKKRRYAWFPAPLLPGYRTLLQRSQQPSQIAMSDLRAVLSAGQASTLDLKSLRQTLQPVARHQQQVAFLSQRQAQIEQLLETAQRHRLAREALTQQIHRLAPQAQGIDLQQGQLSARIEARRQTMVQEKTLHEQRLKAIEEEIALVLRQIGAMEAKLRQGEHWRDFYRGQPTAHWQAAHQHQLAATSIDSEEKNIARRPLPPSVNEALRRARQEHQARVRDLAPHLQAAQQRTHTLRQQVLAITREPLPQWVLTEEVLAARETFVRHQAKWAQHEAEQQRLDQQRQQEQQALNAKMAEAEAAHQTLLDQLAEQQKEAELRLRQSSQSFMAWLDSRYPDWQETIGKVVRQEVLMHPYLSPSVERLNDLLFGVQLDLSEIEAPRLGTQRLQEESEALAAVVKETEQAWQAQRQEFMRQQQNLDKRFRQKASGLAREGQQLRYRMEQAQQQEQRLHRRLQAQQQEARQQREQQRLALAYQLEAALGEEKQWQVQREAADAAWEQAWAAWEAAQSEPTPSAVADEAADALPTDPTERQALAERWKQYQRDVQQWIAPLEAWQAALARLRQQELRLRADRERQLDQWPRQMALMQQQLVEAQTAQADLSEGQATWQELTAWLAERLPHAEAETSWQVEEMIEALQAAKIALATLYVQEEELRQEAQALAAGLGPDNVLRLPVELHDAQDYLALADQLAEVIAHGQWDRIWQELAGRHAPLVTSLAHQVSGFDQDTMRQHRLQRLNQQLAKVDFPAGWQALRVREVPGENPLARALRALLAFAEKHGPALGDHSLFSQGSDDSADEEALALLLRLHQALNHWPSEAWTLVESFALEIEGQKAGQATWQPWQPWAEAPEIAAGIWQRLMLASWAACEPGGGAPLPLLMADGSATSDVITLAQAGKLSPLLVQAPMLSSALVQNRYHLTSASDCVEARLVVAAEA